MSFAVYVHLPYCLKRCPYCDFNTYAVKTVPEERYLEALLSEAQAAADSGHWQGNISSIFLGGGTPSLFSPPNIGALLRRLDSAFGIARGAEVTIEVNPGSLEGAGRKRLEGYREAGVNRVSLGAQSFNDRHLATLGRLHSAADTLAAIDDVRGAGFDELSCDLIFAVPGQSHAEWSQDLDRLIGLGPEHISAYNLTYEKGTPMTGLRDAGRFEAADEDTELAMYETAISRTAAAGFEHYEISNFAKPGHSSRHNLTYWSWQPYLGLGAGAHGFEAPAAGTKEAPWGKRYANVRLPETYMSSAPAGKRASGEILDREMAMSEYLMLSLRLLEGLSTTTFEATFGAGYDASVPGSARLEELGMLRRSADRVRLTHRGLMLADTVLTELAASVDP